jgi:hypothetical protein
MPEIFPISFPSLKKSRLLKNADVSFATTHEDNVNLMVAQVAKKIFKVPPVLPRSDGEHIGRENNGYGTFRAILPTGTTVPALSRIFQVGLFLLAPFLHVNGVGGTNGVAQTATGAFFHIKNRWHQYSFPRIVLAI